MSPSASQEERVICSHKWTIKSSLLTIFGCLRQADFLEQQECQCFQSSDISTARKQSGVIAHGSTGEPDEGLYTVNWKTGQAYKAYTVVRWSFTFMCSYITT